MPRTDELNRLLDRLDRDTESTVTSTRLPTILHQAVRVAVDLGMDTSANHATNQALRDRVETFAQRLALDEHYHRYPGDPADTHPTRTGRRPPRR